MKNFWTIVAGIAGIAWLAWLSLGLWNGLWWTSVEQTAFITQQTAWTSNFDPNPLYVPKNGDSKWGEVICGNGKIEGDEQCEDWQENKCKDQGSGANNDLVCNTYTCKCEQKPITGCYYGLAVAGGTITSHTPWDPKESRDGWVYTVKPWSYTIDCKFDTQHIFINGLSTNPQTYSLPVPSYPGNRYYLNCGSDTGAGCYYTIKVEKPIATGWCDKGLSVAWKDITFTPWSDTKRPNRWGTITTLPWSRDISCLPTKKWIPDQIYTALPSTTYLNPSSKVIFTLKTKLLNCESKNIESRNWNTMYCQYDVKIAWKRFDPETPNTLNPDMK